MCTEESLVNRLLPSQLLLCWRAKSDSIKCELELPFPVVPASKFLAVVLSSDCTFTEHTEKLVKAGNALILTFTAICRFGCDSDSVKAAYVTYATPQLEYAALVWDLFDQKASYLYDKIEAIQKRTAVIITGSKVADHVRTLENLGLESTAR
ncbi:hypothetical protein QYM36_017670 [Artemia franciscana]|uniref:Uncharacterized protein n=1 Tax=Artemia franciscana TaxID=6661 RepID=A0AA88L1C3_ARTSF|nr:hypothetical protein QYM36_017670 [Artemia franciscana]